MSRYRRLLETVRDLNPERVLEVGTWNGMRAAQFMALTNCFYVGFDLFEEVEDGIDEAEKNVKPHSGLVPVALSLEEAGFDRYCLIRGNTRHTLKDYREGKYDLPAHQFDFAFIDGGHSVETIRSDWENVRQMMRPGGVVIFDDYYVPRLEGFGCNDIVAGLEHEVLPEADPVVGGGTTQLVVVRA